MSGSVFLYLAIVVMWLCVLVPMWLRRDKTVMADAHEGAEPYGLDEQAVDEESGRRDGRHPVRTHAHAHVLA